MYPSGRGEDVGISIALAKKIDAHLLHVVVHDSAIFDYFYFKEHKLIDEYSSRPDYYEPISKKTQKQCSGKPEVFADLLAELSNHQKTTIEQIDQVLTVKPLSSEEYEEQTKLQIELMKRFDAGEGESDIEASDEYKVFLAYEDRTPTKQLSNFARLLNISNALASYEDLRYHARLLNISNALARYGDMRHHDRDTEDSREIEKIEQRENFIHIPDLSIELAKKQEEQNRIDEALTKLNQTGILLVSLSSYGLASSLIYTPDRSGGFFIASGIYGDRITELKHYTAPWNEPVNLNLSIEKYISRMKVSSSGKFLVISHGNGVSIYEENQLLKTISHTQYIMDIQFTSDETKLILCSTERIMIISMKTLQQIIAIEFEHATTIVVHPNGYYLLAGKGRKKLAIFDLNTGEVIKLLSTEASEYISEYISKIEFSPDGKWLICGMHEGVRVFEWSEIFSSESILPKPIATSTSEIVDVKFYKKALTYDIAFDWQRNIVVSCELGGIIKATDIATSQSKILLEAPGKPSIWKLDLSRDLATFCTISTLNLSSHSDERSHSIQIWNYLQIK